MSVLSVRQRLFLFRSELLDRVEITFLSSAPEIHNKGTISRHLMCVQDAPGGVNLAGARRSAISGWSGSAGVLRLPAVIRLYVGLQGLCFCS